MKKTAHPLKGIRSSWRDDGLYLGLLSIASLLLRLPGMWESLWYDEVCYTSVFFQSGRQQDILFRDVHPPLYTSLLMGWEALLGDGEAVVRLPSLLFGLASLWVMFAVVKHSFGRRIAWLATGLLALSPVHIWYSHEAKNNMLLLLLTLVTVFWLQRAWAADRTRDWILFTISALAALWTNVFAAWAVAAFFLWLLVQAARGDKDSRWHRVLASGAAVFFGWLPFVWLAFSHAGLLARSYLRPFGFANIYYLFLIYLPHGNTLRTLSPYEPMISLWKQPWWLFSVEGFYLALMAAGAREWLRRWRMNPAPRTENGSSGRAAIELYAMYLAAPPVLVMAASWFYPGLFIERSMILLLPPVLALMACGVMSVHSRTWRGVLLAALVLLCGGALYNLYVGKADSWTVYKQKPDWRGAARYLAGESQAAGGRIFILHTTPGETLDYSYGRFLKVEAGPAAANMPAKLPHGLMVDYEDAKFAGLMKQFGVERVYLIHELTWSQHVARILASLRSSASFSEEGGAHFKDIDIYRFRVSRGGSGIMQSSN